jgi:hypothetical protein
VIPPADPLQVAAEVGQILETIGVTYSIGGSLASSFAGEPRSTLDIDIVVALDESKIPALEQALAKDFYVDIEALTRAVRRQSTVNVIHQPTAIKVDLFVAGGSVLDQSLLDRRLAITLPGSRLRMYVHTPEDILLQKLRWYRLGGDVSDRQWRDVLGIVRVQGERLDRRYLESGAIRLDVSDLLARALRD